MSKKVDTVLDGNTAPMSLKKTVEQAFFRLQGVFPPHMRGKNENEALPPQKQISGFFDRMKAAAVIKMTTTAFAVYDIISL